MLAGRLFVLMSSILIKNGTLVTMNSANRIIRGDLLINHGRIAEIGAADQTADVVIDASKCAVIPGFVQTHIHLCQTLFRGAADDLARAIEPQGEHALA